MSLVVHHSGLPDGPRLLLIHGWSLDSRVFDPLIARWNDRYALSAVDLPGHGASPWTIEVSGIEAWAEQVAETIPPRATVVGWSLGAMIALEVARVSRIERLILVAPTPHFSRSRDWPMGAPPESIARLSSLLRAGYSHMINEFMELQVRGSQDSHLTLARLKHSLTGARSPNLTALEAGLELLRTTDLITALPTIRQPTLVIAGQYDRIVAPQASERMAALMPNARAVVMRRAAHAPFLSHGAQFAALAEAFIGNARTGAGMNAGAP